MNVQSHLHYALIDARVSRASKCPQKKKNKKKTAEKKKTVVSVSWHYSIMFFIHDVDKLISLDSQLLMTKGGCCVLLLIAHLT